MQALVLGEQEIPEPERGRRVVEAQVLEAQITFFDNMTAQRPAVARFFQPGAGQLSVTLIPFGQTEFARRDVHLKVSTNA